MTAKAHSVVAELAFVGMTAIIVAAGIWATLHSRDPHWLDRAGATVAALSAGAVLFQIVMEVRIEEERSALMEQVHKTEELSSTSPLGNLQARLIRKRIDNNRAALIRARLRVAGYVVTGAMLGELLHGFGDLIACRLLVACQT